MPKLSDVDTTPRDRAAGALPTSGVLPLDADWVSPEVDPSFLPEPIERWVRAAAEAWRVPLVLPTAAALCALSAAVQGRTRVRINARWSEPLALYWFLFVPSGGRKSAVLRPAFRPLDVWQAEKRRLWDEQAEERDLELEAVRKALRAAIDAAKRAGWDDAQVIKGEKHIENLNQRQALTKRREELLAIRPPPLVTADNINPQLVPRVLASNYRSSLGRGALALVDTEGRLLDLILGQQTGDLDLATLLKGYTGEPIRHIRASRSSDDLVVSEVPEAVITVCLMAQREYLDKLLGCEQANERGLLGRSIITNLPEMPEAPWDAPPIPEDVQRAYDATVQGIAELELPEVIDLTALPWGRLYDEMRAALGEQGPRFQGWDHRALGQCGRILALCLLAAWSYSQDRNCMEAKRATFHEYLRTAEVSCTIESPKCAKPHGEGENCRSADGGPVSETRARGVINLRYIYNTILSGHLHATRPPAQHTGPRADTLPRRALRWMLCSSAVRPGGRIRAAELRRGLTISAQATTDLVDALLESGHLQPIAETRGKGGLVKRGEYVVMSLDPDAKPPQKADEAASRGDSELPEWLRD